MRMTLDISDDVLFAAGCVGCNKRSALHRMLLMRRNNDCALHGLVF